MSDNFETKDDLNEELERRIDLVEEGVEGVSRMQKRDYILVTIACFGCLAGILLGALL